MQELKQHNKVYQCAISGHPTFHVSRNLALLHRRWLCVYLQLVNGNSLSRVRLGVLVSISLSAVQ